MTKTDGARGPYRTGIERRRQILEKAIEVFGSYGYAGGSLRQIAQEVGVTPAALAKHFGSKEGLLIEVLRFWEEDNRRFEPDIDARGLAAIGGNTSVMAAHVKRRGFLELFLTLSTEASDRSHPAREFVTARYANTLESFARHISEAVDAGEIARMSPRRIEIEARSLIAVMDGLELQWLLDPNMDLVGTFAATLDATIARWRAGSADGTAEH
jgi:Transcriptional regulator